jgi:hypothetical protein
MIPILPIEQVVLAIIGGAISAGAINHVLGVTWPRFILSMTFFYFGFFVLSIGYRVIASETPNLDEFLLVSQAWWVFVFAGILGILIDRRILDGNASNSPG